MCACRCANRSSHMCNHNKYTLEVENILPSIESASFVKVVRVVTKRSPPTFNDIHSSRKLSVTATHRCTVVMPTGEAPFWTMPLWNASPPVAISLSSSLSTLTSTISAPFSLKIRFAPMLKRTDTQARSSWNVSGTLITCPLSSGFASFTVTLRVDIDSRSSSCNSKPETLTPPATSARFKQVSDRFTKSEDTASCYSQGVYSWDANHRHRHSYRPHFHFNKTTCLRLDVCGVGPKIKKFKGMSTFFVIFYT
eukprot:scpid100963/ scgid11416/ 